MTKICQVYKERMNNMRINYLFSDISKEQGFNEIQREYLKKDIKNNNSFNNCFYDCKFCYKYNRANN